MVSPLCPQIPIGISGLAATGTSSVAKRLVELLGWPCRSGGDTLRKIHEKHGMTHVPLDVFAASIPGLDQQIDDDNRRFVESHQERGEGCIIEARLAVEAVAKYPRACRVLLECDPNVCAERRAPVLGVSVPEALRINTARNLGDIERYRRLYGIENICAPERYCLSINTTHMNVDDVCTLIVSCVELR